LTPKFKIGTLLQWRKGGTGTELEKNDPEAIGLIVGWNTDRAYPDHFMIYWNDLKEFVHYRKRDLIDFKEKGTVVLLSVPL
jgi:hypothetical protein|tara:strand:+ start:265 stop:507 length:243 start_codon:yes stop_codon:yes gene_type:complete